MALLAVLSLVSVLATVQAEGILNAFHVEKSKSLCDPSVKQQFGYFDLDTGDKHYFYWFFESRSDPSSDPFILWLNGGPGCSSELGLFTENGPCSVNKDGTDTIRNDNSWNNNANIIFVDQPAGTGFSYGTGFDYDEEQVGKDFYDFLKLFFKKNPKLQEKDFYITGESYGGHYVPAIAHQIWLNNKDLDESSLDYINLAGIGIGNGLVNAAEQYKYYPDMAISTNHHKPAVSHFTYQLMKAVVTPCVALINACESDVPGACIAALETCNLGLMGPYQASGMNPYDMRLKCEVPPLCNDYRNLDKFLNNQTVRDILHIPPEKKWEECDTSVNILFTTHGDGLRSTAKFVTDLVKDINVVVYAGDQDYICNWIGNQAWTDILEWDHKDEFAQKKMSPWKADGKEAGLIKTVDKLTFLRVYEAGHMVPQDQPKAALELLNKLIVSPNARAEKAKVFNFRVVQE